MNIGQNHFICLAITDSSGAHVTGESPTVSVRKASNGYWYDFNDSTFKNTGWTTKAQTLTEDATNEIYYLVWTPPSSETGEEEYTFKVKNTGTYAAIQTETIEYVNNIAATDIVSNGAITTSSGAVSNVTLVATTTTNTDMRGTDSAATAANLATAQADLDTLTGADGVTLATSQPNYAPNTVVPDAAGTAPTAAEIWTASLTEAYPADGTSSVTPTQILYALVQMASEFSKSGTTVTIKKRDASTTAFTLTFDDADAPTSSTQAS